MRKKILGTDLKVSAIGLGCMGMNHAYGAPADKTEMINLIAQAVDMDIRFLTQPKFMAHRIILMVMKYWLEKP